jgi:hypothetical protein
MTSGPPPLYSAALAAATLFCHDRSRRVRRPTSTPDCGSARAAIAMKRVVVDQFQDLSGWSAVASGQAELHISQDAGPHGAAMRLAFDFKGSGGFVVARRSFSFPLPDTYAFSVNLRGAAPRNKFEFKLVDPSGKNVWRYQEDAFEFTPDWQPLLMRSRQIEFGWGPAGGGRMLEVGAIEFVIAAGPGGKGTVWIDDLQVEDRSFASLPAVTASSTVSGHEPRCAVDRDRNSSWRSAASGDPQWFLIDLEEEHEYGGLIIHWDPAAPARSFSVQTSTDASEWRQVYSAHRAAATRSYVYLPDRASRYIRLDLHAADAQRGVGIVNLQVEPYEFSRSISEFFHNVAAAEPRGHYPKYLGRQQTYWSPVGIPNGVTRALLNEEGMVEVDEGTFSIEPFLRVDGALITWADAAPTQHLEEEYLPIPSSVWRTNDIVLTITAFATGESNDAVLYIRYRVEHTRATARVVRLFAVVRPFQVTPPWQSFRALGGVSPVREFASRANAIWVNRTKAVIPLSPPTQFGATTFDEGIMGYLEGGELPAATDVSDDFGYGSGALCFDLNVAPGVPQEVYLAIPFGSAGEIHDAPLLPAGRSGAEQFATAVHQWRAQLAAVDIHLPGAARAAIDTLKTAAAHVLINRDGPALQPGPRRYTRSWIRDGAIMGSALLRVGCAEAMREFIRWYAQYQRDDGFVPCCVDRDGPDWLVEHDSHGQLVYAVMEDFRFTGDRAFLAEMWPAVIKAVDCIEGLRNLRLTPEFQRADKRACYGLLPESASHEGYLAHPVHSYWDDFWALRGLKDAATMAEILGDRLQAQRLATLRDDLATTLYASIRTTIAARHLDYIPGSVEWADFDPTATANAIGMLDESANLPQDVVDRMFDEYFTGFRKKHSGQIDWANYTPYEIRIIGALVRLGKRQSALELLDFFLSDRRPLSWNQWPEIAWRDPTSPGHLGDLPHTWIGAEYILSLLSMFAFEREADQSLVIGAGLRSEWLDAAGGVQVRGLPTWYGTLNFTLQREHTGVLRLHLDGDLTMPRGKIVARPPVNRPLRAVVVNGKPVRTVTAEEVVIDEVPAEVVMS